MRQEERMKGTNSYSAPPIDSELRQLLVDRRVASTRDVAEMIRSRSASQEAIVEEKIAGMGIVREDRGVPTGENGRDLAVSVFKRRRHGTHGLGIYHIHGGGMVTGDRFTSVVRALELVEQFDAVAVTVEYRLAPEHPDPAPITDCFVGLTWTVAHAEELEFDPGRLIILGGSSGGGLAAGATLMARDSGAPRLAAQVLIAPMIDDRNETLSSHQIVGMGVWDRASNEAGWDALLGDRRGTDQVSIYAAPARAADLAGLPPTYIDCGSTEVFRDETMAYAAGIWAAGGVAELHVWPGAHHGFDRMFPDAAISIRARRARTDFIARTVTPREAGDTWSSVC